MKSTKLIFFAALGMFVLVVAVFADNVPVKIPWQPGVQYNFSTNIYWKAETAGASRTLTVEPADPVKCKFKSTPVHTESGITVAVVGTTTDAKIKYKLTVVTANKEGSINVTGALVLRPSTGGGGSGGPPPETPFKIDEFLKKAVLYFSMPQNHTNLVACAGTTTVSVLPSFQLPTKLTFDVDGQRVMNC